MGYQELHVETGSQSEVGNIKARNAKLLLDETYLNSLLVVWDEDQTFSKSMNLAIELRRLHYMEFFHLCCRAS